MGLVNPKSCQFLLLLLFLQHFAQESTPPCYLDSTTSLLEIFLLVEITYDFSKRGLPVTFGNTNH